MDYKKELELVTKELDDIETNFNEMKAKVKKNLQNAKNEEDRNRVMNNFNNKIKKIQSNAEFIENLKKLKNKKIELEEKINNKKTELVEKNNNKQQNNNSKKGIDDEIENLLNKYKNNAPQEKQQEKQEENVFKKIIKSNIPKLTIDKKLSNINKLLKEFN